MDDANDVQEKIARIEEQMKAPDFWQDKEQAQAVIKEYQELKDEAEGKNRYDKGSAVITIFSGAGGLDAEDFAKTLYEMYSRYIEKKKWQQKVLHENENDHGGYRNITFEVQGKDAYGTLKHESGVHRLVRISPFNARQQRHTSFVMVEVIPLFEKVGEIEIAPDEVDIQFAKSGGPGGQNVNKRETAVRIVHKLTGLSAHVDSERSQNQNKEKALEILRGKLYHKEEQDREKKKRGMAVSATTEAEWGNQIRSYVTHPYKMVKDHRTDVEVRDVEAVFDGELDEFIEAEKGIE